MGALAAAAVAAAPAPAASTHPFATAVYANMPSDLRRVRATGATTVRLTLSWPSVAPATEPTTWRPSDPADPNYDWTAFDRQVRKASALGLRVLVTIAGAPSWAQAAPAEADALRARSPSPAAYGVFARAVADRFSGSFEGLPRIRYFEAWNEPNISLYLVPQLVDGKPVAVNDYRSMLNAFARAVHSVHRDNVVIAGGLAPFRDITPSILAQDKDWGPLSFMRALLCVSSSGAPTCKTRVHFDAWSMHPYTSGGPTHKAVLPNDVSLGNVPRMLAVLSSAARAGHLSTARPALWVTEFSWDSNPPDPKGVPTALLSRWVAEALYRMWTDGVSVVTWLQVRDTPLSADFFQSGLWYENGRPKPALRAFRFPFVALPRGDEVQVWGRTPGGERDPVVVQQSTGQAWRKIATLRPDRYGVFRAVLDAPQRGSMRAMIAETGERSLAFGLAPVPDRFFNPFGLSTLLEPPKASGRR